MDGKILLCKRAIEPRHGFWTVPAGFMENGESVQHAAAREAMEEALAHVQIGSLLAVVNVLRAHQVHIMFRARLDPRIRSSASDRRASRRSCTPSAKFPGRRSPSSASSSRCAATSRTAATAWSALHFRDIDWRDGKLVTTDRLMAQCTAAALDRAHDTGAAMTFVVTENCIKCKYTDCVEVCPVDCFHEGPNFLVIDPDECIDCTLCEPECPVEAIFSEEELPAGQEQFRQLNAELAKSWPVITEKKAAPPDAKEWEGKPDKAKLLER